MSVNSLFTTKSVGVKSLCAAIDLNTKLWKATRISVRHATGWKRRMMQQEEVKKVTYQYVGKNTKKSDRLYTWGYAATGALGVRTFLHPKSGFPTREKCVQPFRLKFFQENQLQVKNTSCGYGYTVYVVQTNEGECRLYGTGINTDSQIGYHEYPVNSGRILSYLIEPAYIRLPVSEKLAHVACGRAHTVMVTENNQVFSMGNNSAGQCGRNIIEDEVYSESQIVSQVAFNEPIKQVVCGQDHTLFLTETGQVYSCGLGADGQTGLGHYDVCGQVTRVTGDIEHENIVQLSCKADCVLAVSEKGEVFGWGNSEYNQLSCAVKEDAQVNIPRHLPFKDVGKIMMAAAGGSACAVVNESGEVFVWGYGLLGKGPKLESSPIPSKIPDILFGKNQFNTDSEVISIDSGMNYFVAITNKGDLYTWGRNKSGVLGLGNDLDQFFPFKVSVPAAVKQTYCGVDHIVVKAKTYA